MIWIVFLSFVFILLLLDLGVFHKGNSVMGVKEATIWTLIWILLSLLFNVFVYFAYKFQWLGLGVIPGIELTEMQVNTNAKNAGLEFFTGYILEKSLSIDNIFVMALIFTYFKIQPKYQHRILFWGIVGALVFRSLMIGLGIGMIQKFSWSLVLLGVILVWSGGKMLFSGDEEENNIGESIVVKFLNKLIKVKIDAPQKFFFFKREGQLYMTGSFLALMVIEFTDLLFALDSIPAIIAITDDFFIVFTSNIMAILGLRSLYFVLAASLNDFKYLKTSLAFILIFVGVKMTLHYLHEKQYIHWDIPTELSLLFIVLALVAGVLFSLSHNKKQSKIAENK